MSDVIDLDALVPQTATIKFGNEEIQVQPPTTADLLRLGSLGSKMEKAADLTADEMAKLVADITATVVEVIPELADKRLNTAQLLALVQLIGEMATPPETKELEKKGITTAGDADPKV